VAVEALGYRPAWDALRLIGAKLEPIPVDEDGLNVDALARLLRRRRVRAVYVTPHHQYPTTVTMSAARRLALLELARKHRMLIIEDDYDHEIHFQGRPVLPLLAGDDSGVVASVGTLSKVLAPGLRLGFIVAPTELAQRVARLRAVMDRQGDHPMEATVAELIEEGELQRHVRKMRVIYERRRDALAKLLETRLGDTLSFELPTGGISVWAKHRRQLSLDRWLARARQRGVVVNPGSVYRFDGREPGTLRLVFARLTEGELANAIEVLRATAPR
jgi:GntR family transcriptional regulator/MocR family aminotransferase